MLDDDEQEAVLRNPFPSPPSHYQKYTSHNLSLLQLLKTHTASQEESSRSGEKDIDERRDGFKPLAVSLEEQRELLKDHSDVPDWPLSQLEKPRVDWILEEGHYNVYGDTWFVR